MWEAHDECVSMRWYFIYPCITRTKGAKWHIICFINVYWINELMKLVEKKMKERVWRKNVPERKSRAHKKEKHFQCGRGGVKNRGLSLWQKKEMEIPPGSYCVLLLFWYFYKCITIICNIGVHLDTVVGAWNMIYSTWVSSTSLFPPLLLCSCLGEGLFAEGKPGGVAQGAAAWWEWLCIIKETLAARIPGRQGSQRYWGPRAEADHTATAVPGDRI